MKNKKILYIYQYFRHPGEPGGTRAYWIAKEMVAQGYTVTMVTQKNAVNPEYRDAKPLERVNIDGIDVVYIKNSYSNDMSLYQRFYSFVNFMIKSTIYSLKEKKVDIIFATSTPLSVGFPALVVKKIKRIPLIFEVRDLWPEGPVQMGIIKNRLLINVLEWFERSIYQNSKHVIALSPGMAEGVARHIPVNRISIIPNMAKIDKFWPREKNWKLAKEFGIADHTFKVIHFGQMGASNDLHYIVDAAKICKESGYDDIEFIFLGTGKVKAEIRERAGKEELNMIRIIDRQPMAMVSEIVNFCDVSLVTFADLPILYTNSPNKLFDSLSAGKPVIVNSAGWTKHMVESNNCGFYVTPTNPQDLVQKILLLKNNRELKDTMCLNARKLAETKFDKSILCPQVVSLVDSILL